jgi:DnaJ-class molecular chaperone
MRTCGLCHGSGTREYRRVDIHADGTREIYTGQVPCSECEGTGTVLTARERLAEAELRRQEALATSFLTDWRAK